MWRASEPPRTNMRAVGEAEGSMSTRESMRRELKELAKLAETMRKDAASEAKPNAYSFEAEAVAEAAAHTPDRPLSASSVTVPPVVPPSLPPPASSELEFPQKSGGRRGLIAIGVGAALAAAPVGGAALRRSVASPPPAANPATA